MLNIHDFQMSWRTATSVPARLQHQVPTPISVRFLFTSHYVSKINMLKSNQTFLTGWVTPYYLMFVTQQIVDRWKVVTAPADSKEDSHTEVLALKRWSLVFTLLSVHRIISIKRGPKSACRTCSGLNFLSHGHTFPVRPPVLRYIQWQGYQHQVYAPSSGCVRLIWGGLSFWTHTRQFHWLHPCNN